MTGIGEIHGYAILWHEESCNLSKPGERPCYDRIAPHAISIARTAKANYHHIRETVFAFISDRTLEFGTDNIGLWFSACIPDDAAGFDLFNGLMGGRWQAVSPELEGITKRFDARSGAHIVTRASLTGVAIVPRDSALFPGLRCWLGSCVPDEPQAKKLHELFAARKRRKAEQVHVPRMPQAMITAMRMARR
jgi:hypothetical protein